MGGSVGGSWKDSASTFAAFLCDPVHLLLKHWSLRLYCLWTSFGGMHFLTSSNTVLHPTWLMGKTFSPVHSLLGPFSQLPFLTPSSLCMHPTLASAMAPFPKHELGPRWHRVISLCSDLQMWCWPVVLVFCWLLATLWAALRASGKQITVWLGPPNSPTHLCCSRPWSWLYDFPAGSPWAATQPSACWSSRWSWRLLIQHWCLRSY